MPRRSVIFCFKKNFLNLIVFIILVLNVSAWTLSKTFWKNSIKWYGLLILWVRWEAKDVNPYGYLKCEVLSNIYLFNILCRVSQTLAGCLSENILRRKLAVVYLIGIFKFFSGVLIVWTITGKFMITINSRLSVQVFLMICYFQILHPSSHRSTKFYFSLRSLGLNTIYN